MKNNVVKLNAFAKLLTPKELLELVEYSIILLVAWVITNGFTATSMIMLVCTLLIYYVIYSLLGITRETRKIQLDKGVMHFTYWQRLENNDGSGGTIVRTRGVTPKAKVKYTVTDIENLRFEQNKLEKLFNCGHFSFEGNTVYETDSDCIVPKTSFMFYGLTGFRQIKKEICDILGVKETEDEK